MVKSTKLDKVARDYANKEYPPYHEMPDDNWKQRAGYTKGFKAGIEWYKNNIWHSPNEEPNSEDEVLLIAWKIGQSRIFHDTGYFVKSEGKFKIDINVFISTDKVELWAYVKDLLPLNTMLTTTWQK